MDWRGGPPPAPSYQLVKRPPKRLRPRPLQPASPETTQSPPPTQLPARPRRRHEVTGVGVGGSHSFRDPIWSPGIHQAQAGRAAMPSPCHLLDSDHEPQPQVRKGRDSSSPGVLSHTNLVEGGRQSGPTRAPPLQAPPPPELLGDQAPPPPGDQATRHRHRLLPPAWPCPPLSPGCSPFPRLAPPRLKAPLSSLRPGPRPRHRGPADHQSQATSSLQGTSPGTQPHPSSQENLSATRAEPGGCRATRGGAAP